MGLAEFLETAPEEEEGQFTYVGLSELSGISTQDAASLAEVWREWGERRMENFLGRLSGLAAEDPLLEFEAVFKRALASGHAAVRRIAIEGLAECDDRALVSKFLDLLSSDMADSVRAAAAQGLARFTSMAVEGKLVEHDGERLLQGLLTSLNNARETDEVRRRALEAAAVFGNEELSTRIRAAYISGDPAEVQCALHCMGRSCDARWLPEVLEQLHSPDASLRFEAASSLGQIGEENHVLHLADTLEDTDPVVAAAAAASLASLGGSAARALLQKATESEFSLVAEAAQRALREMALDNVLFEDEPGVFGIAPAEAMGSDDESGDELEDEDDGWPDPGEGLEFSDELDFATEGSVPLLGVEFATGDDLDELDDDEEIDPFARQG